MPQSRSQGSYVTRLPRLPPPPSLFFQPVVLLTIRLYWCQKGLAILPSEISLNALLWPTLPPSAALSRKHLGAHRSLHPRVLHCLRAKFWNFLGPDGPHVPPGVSGRLVQGCISAPRGEGAGGVSWCLLPGCIPAPRWGVGGCLWAPPAGVYPGASSWGVSGRLPAQAVGGAGQHPPTGSPAGLCAFCLSSNPSSRSSES